MKAWMKVLVWLGLGGGIGFFAGYQAGKAGCEKEFDAAVQEAADEFREKHRQEWNEHFERLGQQTDNLRDSFDSLAVAAKEAADAYRGDDETLWSFTPSEDPEMPEEPPVIGDEAEIEDIPELHPQHMTQRQVTEEYFYSNPNNFDQEDLLYYEGDDTLYNKDTRKAIDKKDEIDEVLGIGMLTNFHMKGADLGTIFVENPTMGMLFRIDRVEDAFGDILNGVVAEEIDEEDDTE